MVLRPSTIAQEAQDGASMATIEARTKVFAAARADLAILTRSLVEETEQLKRRRLPAIRRAVNRAKTAKEELEAAIDAGRALFARPRSRLLHGVRVGLRKATGKLSWADPDIVVRLIRKHLPDKAELLIKVKETPVKKALAQLQAADLKRLGVTVEETGDAVLIEPTDSAIDKLVNALLEEKTEAAGDDAEVAT